MVYRICPNIMTGCDRDNTQVIWEIVSKIEKIYQRCKNDSEGIENELMTFGNLLNHIPIPVPTIRMVLENSWGKLVFDREIIFKLVSYWFRMKNTPQNKKCLIVVDVQNDFLTGSLPANDNYHEVIKNINHLLKCKHDQFDVIVYSKEWHPPSHISFFKNHKLYNGVRSRNSQDKEVKMYEPCTFQLPNEYGNIETEMTLWPDHCIMGTHGAEHSSELYIIDDLKKDVYFIKKAMNPWLETFSVFQDTLKIDKTPLLGTLLDHQITDVYVCGCVAECCVLETALDSMRFNFNTYFIKDAIVYLYPQTKECFPSLDPNIKVVYTQDVETFLDDHQIIQKIQR